MFEGFIQGVRILTRLLVILILITLTFVGLTTFYFQRMTASHRETISQSASVPDQFPVIVVTTGSSEKDLTVALLFYKEALLKATEEKSVFLVPVERLKEVNWRLSRQGRPAAKDNQLLRDAGVKILRSNENGQLLEARALLTDGTIIAGLYHATDKEVQPREFQRFNSAEMMSRATKLGISATSAFWVGIAVIIYTLRRINRIRSRSGS